MRRWDKSVKPGKMTYDSNKDKVPHVSIKRETNLVKRRPSSILVDVVNKEVNS